MHTQRSEQAGMSDASIHKEELNKILRLHKAWTLQERGGECADLSHADLRGAKLCGADLSHADLSHADLRCADLRDAKLCGAVLSGASTLNARGCVLLPACDMRGYSDPHAILCGEEWRVRVGCRDFSISEARAHWGIDYYGSREQADIYLYAVDWLESWIERHGADHAKMEVAA